MKDPAISTNRSSFLVKRVAALACVFGLAMGASAQGLVNFLNNHSTLISVRGAPMLAPIGTYYFGLLTAPAGSTDWQSFTFSGVYGTNQAVAGRFTGGFGVAVPGWAPGETRAVMVAGWFAYEGHDFDSPWIFPAFSDIAPNVIAGGFDGTFNFPNGIIFGGGSISRGFDLVPEPNTLALFGAFTLLALCRKVRGHAHFRNDRVR